MVGWCFVPMCDTGSRDNRKKLKLKDPDAPKIPIFKVSQESLEDNEVICEIRDNNDHSDEYASTELAIVDDDVDINNMRILQEDEIELYNLDEDAPQIVGIIDERPKDMQVIEDFRSSKRWKVVATDADLENLKITDNSVTSDLKALNKEKRLLSSKKDVDKRLLSEKSCNSNDSGFKTKNNSEFLSRKYARVSPNSVEGSVSDVSPPRKSDLSKRKGSPSKTGKKHSGNSLRNKSIKDFPPHNKRSSSDDSDSSSPRISRRSDYDVSTHIVSKNKSSSFISRKELKEKDDSDASPPRISKDRYHSNVLTDQAKKKYNKAIRKQKKYDSDISPPRVPKEINSDTRKYDIDDSDPSPPRKSRKQYDSNTSPVRKSGKSYDSDISPPRKSRRKDDYNKFQSRESKKTCDSSESDDSDASQSRKKRKIHKPDLKHGQSRRKYDSDASPPRISKEKYSSNEPREKKLRSRDDSDKSPPRSYKTTNSRKRMENNKTFKYESSKRHGTDKSSERYHSHNSPPAFEQSRKFDKSDRRKNHSHSSYKHSEMKSSKLNKSYEYDKKCNTKGLPHNKKHKKDNYRTRKLNNESSSESASSDSGSSNSNRAGQIKDNEYDLKYKSDQDFSHKKKSSEKMQRNKYENKIHSLKQTSSSESELSVKKRSDSSMKFSKHTFHDKISKHRMLDSNTKQTKKGNASHRVIKKDKGRASRTLKKRYKSDSDFSSSSTSSSSDSSPSRDQKTDNHELYKKSKRSSHCVNNLPQEDKYNESGKMKKTLDGKQAGLQNASELKDETENAQKKEAELFSLMEDSVSGKNAKTIVRDRKTGKQRDLEEEARQQEIINEGRQKVLEKYSELGKGLKQVQQQKDNLEAALKEMSKPLARYADDQDLDKHLRDADREGDPMLDYIRSKRANEPGTSKPKPKYEGSFLPNRFGICPGHRWDGVDRSSGYEKRWFETQNAKKAREEEAYKWSTADM